jgi:hypothetical protein
MQTKTVGIVSVVSIAAGVLYAAQFRQPLVLPTVRMEPAISQGMRAIAAGDLGKNGPVAIRSSAGETLREWRRVYGMTVVDNAMVSASDPAVNRKGARKASWTPSLEAVTVRQRQPNFQNPGGITRVGWPGLLPAQAESIGSDLGWFTVWAWEDGDEDYTIEGMVEFGLYHTGQRVLMNVQLATPTNESAYALWTEVLDQSVGHGASTPYDGRQPQITNASFRRIQYPDENTYICNVQPYEVDNAVAQCILHQAGEIIAEAWRDSWPAATGASVRCNRGNWAARLSCVAVNFGSAFTGNFLKRSWYRDARHQDACARDRMHAQICAQQGGFDCRQTRQGCH